MTIRRNLKNGSEVTEPLSGDGYRITRCDTEGKTTISMTVLPIVDTDGKRVLLPAVTVRPRSIIAPTYGDPVRDTRYRAIFSRALPKLLASVLPRTAGRASRDPNFGAPGTGVATAAAQSACNDKTHAESPGAWPENRYTWRWNAKTFGESSSTLTALKKAHEQWDRTVTDCSLKDMTDFTTHYDGTTTQKAGVNDGVNTIDKADLSKGPCGSSAIACTWVWWIDDAYTETDTRFATDVKWSNKGSDGAYDYQGIARARVRAQHRPQRPRRQRQADDALPGHARLHGPAHPGSRRHPRGPRALRRVTHTFVTPVRPRRLRRRPRA